MLRRHSTHVIFICWITLNDFVLKHRRVHNKDPRLAPEGLVYARRLQQNIGLFAYNYILTCANMQGVVLNFQVVGNHCFWGFTFTLFKKKHFAQAHYTCNIDLVDHAKWARFDTQARTKQRFSHRTNKRGVLYMTGCSKSLIGSAWYDCVYVYCFADTWQT